MISMRESFKERTSINNLVNMFFNYIKIAALEKIIFSVQKDF
jgi:hypothetical protein